MIALVVSGLLAAAPALVAAPTVPVQPASINRPVAHPPASEEDCMRATWLDDLWPQLDQVQFRPTTLEERQAFTRLVPAILDAVQSQSVPAAALVALARSVGFDLIVRKHGTDAAWVLREKPLHWHGAGAYVFRVGEASSDVIEAPHNYFDVGTGRLAAGVFTCGDGSSRPRALFTNTAHRYRSHKGERKSDPDHPADVAHNPDHLFSLVTDLSANGLRGMRVLQLHGFSADEAEGRNGFAAVVSNGTRTPSAWTRQLRSRLAPILGEGVKLYPEEAEVLGATTNAQGRLLQRYPGTSFAHLELSAESRRLLEQPEPLQRFARAVLGHQGE